MPIPRTVTIAAIATLVGVSAAVFAAPAAAAQGVVTVGGSELGIYPVPTSFVADVTAPSYRIPAVKFVLDGNYLGQDTTAPYSWPITTKVGSHSLTVKWGDPSGTKHETKVAFTSSTAASAPSKAPVVEPAPPTPTESAPDPTSVPTVTVSTASQLTSALKAAKPGAIIQLKDGTYKGQFVAAANGTAQAPITLQGTRQAVLTVGSLTSGYGLNVTGDYWRLSGFSVTNAAKGVVLDGSSYSTVDSLSVSKIGNEGIHLRRSSDHVTVQNNVIRDTGYDGTSYGEGVYVGSAFTNWGVLMGSSSSPDASSYAIVRNNTFENVPGEGIDIKEGTTGGLYEGNQFSNVGYSGRNDADSWVDVKGTDNVIQGNSGRGTKLDAFQLHRQTGREGQGNVFRDNTVLGGVPGLEVSDLTKLPNTVYCHPTGAAKGLSNIDCTN